MAIWQEQLGSQAGWWKNETISTQPRRTTQSVPADSLDIVDAELWRLDPLPAGGEPLLLERVRPVRRLGVVVDEVAPAAHRVPHRPAQGQREVVCWGGNLITDLYYLTE